MAQWLCREAAAAIRRSARAVTRPRGASQPAFAQLGDDPQIRAKVLVHQSKGPQPRHPCVQMISDGGRAMLSTPLSICNGVAIMLRGAAICACRPTGYPPSAIDLCRRQSKRRSRRQQLEAWHGGAWRMRAALARAFTHSLVLPVSVIAASAGHDRGTAGSSPALLSLSRLNFCRTSQRNSRGRSIRQWC